MLLRRTILLLYKYSTVFLKNLVNLVAPANVVRMCKGGLGAA